jgi:hypothetical protein
MLDLPDLPLLDKDRLVGGCLRLPLTVEAGRLAAEVAALPEEVWGSNAGRVGTHRQAQAVFLRGQAPADGDLPISDRPALATLPYARALIEHLIPAPPLRCLLARLPGGTVIRPHVDDRAPYFAKTLRVHIPVETHALAWMYSAGHCYRMAAGEVWVLNNSTVHGVWNADATRARTHLICDFAPTRALLDLLATGERDLGLRVDEVERQLLAAPAPPSGTVAPG